MKVIREARAFRAWADEQSAANRRIGLVPTMGALHAGHVSLCDLARARADALAVSIFVNPTQFGPSEDFTRYPRDLDGDMEKLAGHGVDVVFAPDVSELYPKGFDTYVVPNELSTGLCGRSRPGHFRGVCTVVHLFFRISRAHVAVFGEKDFQQLAIIRRMTRDLWLDVEIIGAPIVRETDGLAMSSRNAYLSASERADALVLSQSLAWMRESVKRGERNATRLRDGVLERIGAKARVDYVEIVDRESLQPLTAVDRPAVAAVAAFVGKTRLIDNVQL